MPDLKLTVEISEREAERLRNWQAQGLITSDEDTLDSLLLMRRRNADASMLNKKQRVSILIGVVFISLMLLVPPYALSVSGRRSSSEYKVYAFIFSPQKQVGISFDGIEFHSGDSVELDLSALMIQCLLVGVLTGGLVFFFHVGKKS